MTEAFPAGWSDDITVRLPDGRTIPYGDCDFNADQEAAVKQLMRQFMSGADPGPHPANPDTDVPWPSQ